MCKCTHGEQVKLPERALKFPLHWLQVVVHCVLLQTAQSYHFAGESKNQYNVIYHFAGVYNKFSPVESILKVKCNIWLFCFHLQGHIVIFATTHNICLQYACASNMRCD